MNKPGVYISCPIRGKMGKDATLEYMKTNCEIAKLNLKWLEEKYPEIDWICPAAHDSVVQQLLSNSDVGFGSVLKADNNLQKECTGFLTIEWEKSRGVDDEFSLSVELNQVTVYFVNTLYLKTRELDTDYFWINSRLQKFVDEVLWRFYEK